MQFRIDALKKQADELLGQQRPHAAGWCYWKILLLGFGHRDVAVKDRCEAYINLGRIYYVCRMYRTSAFVCKRALGLAERKIGPVSVEVVTALDMLAHACAARADREAEASIDWNHVRTGHHGRILRQAAFERSPHGQRAMAYRERKHQVEKQLEDLKPA